ncbi:MAG: hypothetical protein ACI31D_06160 [Candidatus Limisoma sp.]
MKKLLVLVAASALALTACTKTKSVESLQKQVDEIVTEEGTIPADRIVEAFDLYEEILDKAIDVYDDFDFDDKDDVKEADDITNLESDFRTCIEKTAVDNGEEYEKQISKIPFEATFDRIEEKKEKLEELYKEKVKEAFETMFSE